VLFADLAKYLKDNGVRDKDTKIGRSLTALGLANVTKKVNKKATHVRIGIRELKD
jgi:hypothetical protein